MALRGNFASDINEESSAVVTLLNVNGKGILKSLHLGQYSSNYPGIIVNIDGQGDKKISNGGSSTRYLQITKFLGAPTSPFGSYNLGTDHEGFSILLNMPFTTSCVVKINYFDGYAISYMLDV